MELSDIIDILERHRPRPEDRTSHPDDRHNVHLSDTLDEIIEELFEAARS